MEWARVVRLNNTNYATWSFAVAALLRREQLWKFVEPGTPPNPVTSAWTDGDEKTLATIQLLVDESQYDLIRDKTTAKTTWEALKQHHNKTSLGQKVTLLKQISNQNYRIGDNMEEYLSAIEKQYARLQNSGFEMSECLKVALILRGLPDVFNPLTTALEARDEAELTLAMVKVKLVDEADKQCKQRDETEEQALRIGSSQQPRNLTCFFCGKQGHRKRECKLFLAERGYDGKIEQKTEEKVTAVRDDAHVESFTFMARVGGFKAGAWLIDSGAMTHLANDKRLFVRLDTSKRPMISAANGKLLRTEGVGDCTIQCLNDRGENVSITLTDVVFTPELKHNLVSVVKLSNKGVRAEFDSKRCRLMYEKKIIAVADRISGLYCLNQSGERSSLVNGERRKEDARQVRSNELVCKMSVGDRGVRKNYERNDVGAVQSSATERVLEDEISSAESDVQEELKIVAHQRRQSSVSAESFAAAVANKSLSYAEVVKSCDKYRVTQEPLRASKIQQPQEESGSKKIQCQDLIDALLHIITKNHLEVAVGAAILGQHQDQEPFGGEAKSTEVEEEC